MLTIGMLPLPSVLLSLGSWSSLYFFLRWLEPNRKAELHCRIVTVLHAVLITVLSAWATFVQGPWPFTDAGGPNTPLQIKVTTICLGYFLFDFSWCLYFKTEGPPMLLHHTLSIIGLTWTLSAGKYGTEMMATLCGSEVTNPLLQLRWFLREAGRYHTVLGEVVDVVFMSSFFTMRIIVGSVLIYCYYQQPTDFWGRLAATSIYLVGWMFWVSIFQYAVYKYTKKYKAWCRSKKETGVSDALAAGKEHNLEKEKVSENGAAASSSTSGMLSSHEDQEFSSGCSKNGQASKVVPTLSVNGVHHRSNGIGYSSNGTLSDAGDLASNNNSESMVLHQMRKEL